MSFDLWLTFVAASVALLLIPGPTVLLVLSYALSKGRSVAIAAASGVALGDLVAMVASLAGLGALVLTSATAFVVLKWIGAVYLVWLGLRLIRSAPKDGMDLPDPVDVTPRGVFRHATLVTALNPKSIAFFIAFVPQFIDPALSFVPQAGVLVATFVTLAALNALAYALVADRVRTVMLRPRLLGWVTRIGGATLVGMGVLTATLKRTAP